MGTGLHSVIIAIAAIDWTRFCRVVRAETMMQKQQDHVASAVTIGLGRLHILWGETRPNVVPLLVVLFTLEVRSSIRWPSARWRFSGDPGLCCTGRPGSGSASAW